MSNINNMRKDFEAWELKHRDQTGFWPSCFDAYQAATEHATTKWLPIDGKLRFKASKTAKWAYFDVADSPVLSAMVERREASKAHCVMLLASDTGRAVSEWMLSEKRWNEAKQAAIKAFPRLKADLDGLYLRDLRKRAADLADDMESASKLLQHSSVKLTETHYRTKPTKLQAVR